MQKTVPLLPLDQAPSHPVKRVLWLSELDNLVRHELYLAYRKAYFEARQQGMFEYAVEVGPFSRTQAERLTREENETLGRTIRWYKVDPPDAEALKTARRYAKQARA